MSTEISTRVFADEWQLGDMVEFNAPEGGRLQGRLVRIYNTRDVFHVETWQGRRYQAELEADQMRLLKSHGGGQRE